MQHQHVESRPGVELRLGAHRVTDADAHEEVELRAVAGGADRDRFGARRDLAHALRRLERQRPRLEVEREWLVAEVVHRQHAVGAAWREPADDDVRLAQRTERDRRDRPDLAGDLLAIVARAGMSARAARAGAELVEDRLRERVDAGPGVEDQARVDAVCNANADEKVAAVGDFERNRRLGDDGYGKREQCSEGERAVHRGMAPVRGHPIDTLCRELVACAARHSAHSYLKLGSITPAIVDVPSGSAIQTRMPLAFSSARGRFATGSRRPSRVSSTSPRGARRRMPSCTRSPASARTRNDSTVKRRSERAGDVGGDSTLRPNTTTSRPINCAKTSREPSRSNRLPAVVSRYGCDVGHRPPRSKPTMPRMLSSGWRILRLVGRRARGRVYSTARARTVSSRPADSLECAATPGAGVFPANTMSSRATAVYTQRAAFLTLCGALGLASTRSAVDSANAFAFEGSDAPSRTGRSDTEAIAHVS